MAKKSKLLAALDAHKGRNFYLEKQKKLQKAAEKRKGRKGEETDEENEAEEKKTVEQTEVKDKSKKNKKDSKKEQVTLKKDQEKSQKSEESGESSEESEDESQDEDNEKEDAEVTKEDSNDSEDDEDEDEDEEDEEEEDSDIPLSDLEEEDMADVIPHQRLTINNSAAIRAALKRISFTAPFSDHNSLISKTSLEVPDVNDDLQRELAFYTVCQTAAKEARSLLLKEGIPFSRPTDYFAEMVKSDEHMGKIKKKIYEEASAKKASAEAKRQRDLKKFGKQVQVAKLQQRQKEKREMLEKVSSLKRKRNAGGTTGPEDQSDLFDVALDDANKPGDKTRAGPNIKRQKKNEKYGFGGKKRHNKSGDAKSSADMSAFSVGRMKGKGGKRGGGSGGAAKRPGKGRRAAMRS